MSTDLVRFHEEASAEYDAAFEWYLERSPDAALKFDTEVNRALAQILLSPRRWAARFARYSQVPAQAISLSSDLSGAAHRRSNCGRCPH
jgi:plasmid stabilization system protein ParE